MKKIKETSVALLIAVSMLLTCCFFPGNVAASGAEVTVTNFAVKNNKIAGNTQITVTLSSTYAATFSDLQSKENATGNPTAGLIRTAEYYLRINGKTIPELLEGKNWNNAVRVNLTKSSTKQMFDILVYDLAFGQRLATMNFTFELMDGACDSAGGKIAPTGYVWNATGSTATPMTVLTSGSVGYHSGSGTTVKLVTSAAFTSGSTALQSVAPTGNPKPEFVSAIAEKILINGSTVGAIAANTPEAVNVDLTNEGGKQAFEITVADGAFGKGALKDQDFTVEFADGMCDAAGTLISGRKYQYLAEGETFKLYEAPRKKISATDMEVMYMADYGLTEIMIPLASKYLKSYEAINHESADPIPPADLLETVEHYILINGIAVEDYTASLVYIHLRHSGGNQMFDIFVYDTKDGKHLTDEDFTIEFLEGAVDASFNEINPVKFTYDSETGLVTSNKQETIEQTPLRETKVKMVKEVDEARGGWYFEFDSDVNYIDNVDSYYSDLTYFNNTELSWRPRIDTPYFRNSIEAFLTVTIGEETHTPAEWNTIYNTKTGNGRLIGVLFGKLYGANQVFLYYWGKGDFHPSKNVITVNFLKGFCLPDGEGLTETRSFTRSKHDVENGSLPEWWSDDGTVREYDVFGEIRKEDIVRDEKEDKLIDVSFSTETTEGTGMIYFNILTDKNFGQDQTNLFNGLNYFTNDTVWRPAIDTEEFKYSMKRLVTIKVGDLPETALEDWNADWYVGIYKTNDCWKLLMHYKGNDPAVYDWWNKDLEVSFKEGFTLPTGDMLNPLTFKREGGHQPAEAEVENAWSIISGMPGPGTLLSKLTTGSLSPKKGDKKITLPTKEGYFYELVRSSKPYIVDLDGNVVSPEKNTYVSLTIEVTRQSDMESDVTRVSVLVPGTANPSDTSEEEEEEEEEEYEWKTVWVDEDGNVYDSEFDSTDRLSPYTGETMRYLVFILAASALTLSVLALKKISLNESN